MRPAVTSALYHPLNHILGSPALVRVARVLAGHGGSLGVADIARRTRLALPSTRAALRRLIDLEVASGLGVGRTMVCALQPEHPLTPALLALFAAERDQAEVVLNAIRRGAAELRPRPLAVWLYGSVARGADQPASDIDIALVSALSDPTPQADAARDAIAAELPGLEHRISVIALGPKDVARLARTRAKFWRELERDAVVLAGDAPAGVIEKVKRKKKSRQW